MRTRKGFGSRIYKDSSGGEEWAFEGVNPTGFLFFIFKILNWDKNSTVERDNRLRLCLSNL